MAGPNYNNILFSSIADRNSCNDLLFEGGYMSDSIRGLPLLQNKEWREAQTLAVCQQLQGSIISDAILTGSNNSTQLNFRARASNQGTP